MFMHASLKNEKIRAAEVTWQSPIEQRYNLANISAAPLEP